jgi:hypothetical protein
MERLARQLAAPQALDYPGPAGHGAPAPGERVEG